MKFALKSWICLLLGLSSGSAATINVSLGGFQFVPKDITINVGDTVVWTNTEITQHDVVSGQNGVPNGILNSNNQYGRLMRRNETYAFTFNSAGTFPYFCTPHWSLFNMVGSVTVRSPNIAPSISISSPANNANFSSPANFSLVANASDSDGSIVKVEFFQNGIPLGTVSAAPYSVSVNDLGPGNYEFSAVATDNSGATASTAISINVSGSGPAITSFPQSQTVLGGSDITLAAQASGTPPLTFQWAFNQTPIAGATDASLQLLNLSETESGVYTFTVSNPFGSASASATLTVTNPPAGSPPEFTTEPVSQIANLGSNVTFSANAIGSTPLELQWFFNSAPLPGATDFSLTISNVTLADAGNYFVVASNAFGVATSSNAALTVNVPPVCQFALSQTNAAFPPAGGITNITISTGSNCSWTVVNSNFWIVPRVTSGFGSHSIQFTILTNATRSSRTGIVSVAGLNFTISQSAPSFAAKGDFTRDGQTDFLWQNANRTIALWQMKGLDLVRAQFLNDGKAVGAGWEIVGVHDFNKDRNPDILWENVSGAVAVWLMRGTNRIGSVTISGAPLLNTSWRIVGVADFNGDGHADFLWKNLNGYLALWLMNGTKFSSQVLLLNGEPVPSEWQVVGIGDFTKDGQQDILWRQPNGEIVLWMMSGTAPNNGVLLSNLPRLTDARIVGVNDLNQDGNVDLIWRKNSGALFAWMMKGTNRVAEISINSGRPVAGVWKLVGPKN